MNKQKIKHIARIWAGSSLSLDIGSNSPEESGCSEEELLAIQEEYMAIGRQLLKGEEAINFFPDIVKKYT